MSLFNTKAKRAKHTLNYEGATAQRHSDEYRLVSLLLTNFLQAQFYRDAPASAVELTELATRVDPRFAAQAAVYARNEFGMRSVTHLLAAAIADRVAGETYAKGFYDKIVRRPDDMLEISAAYLNDPNSGKNLTNAMRKGFAKAFDRFDGYQLAKYRGEGKQFKLVDVVNLVRPVPTRRNAKALTELVNGTLRNAATWESKLSAAGQTTDKAAAKQAAWKELLDTNKLGYFALLRNLRNILTEDPTLVNVVARQLTDAKRIKGSLVLPFRLLTAYKVIEKASLPAKVTRQVLQALEIAIDRSCENLPELDNTLVVVDNSGSMGSAVAGSEHIQCNELGAVFAMALAKRSNADLMEFGTYARYIKYQLNAGVLAFAKEFPDNNKVGHGTDFDAIFANAKRAYARIVIISDMQSGLHRVGGDFALNQYRDRFGADPTVYCIDLRGYGTSHFSPGKVIQLAGFSEKLFDLMGVAEQNPEVLLDKIRSVEL